MLIESTLRQAFRPASWQSLLQDIFPNELLDLLPTPRVSDSSLEHITSITQLGKVMVGEENILLLTIETTGNVQLARNRVGLRSALSPFLADPDYDAVIAVFHQTPVAATSSRPANSHRHDWRITYASRTYGFDDDSQLKKEETAPKRFTFLVGPGEPCRTAAERLASIQNRGENLTLKHIEDAFSVEKLSKEFFDKYKAHYESFVAELLSDERASASRALFDIPTHDQAAAQEKADKPIRDFAKKLLGRLIFLHFLQKKGWLHSEASTPPINWSTGDRDFLLTYLEKAKSAGHGDTFHSTWLAPLFFQALNEERPDSLFTIQKSHFTIPYLNGGLFDPDPAELQAIDFPLDLFQGLLDFFAHYNFTIDENDPEDHQVGIDPEMLGRIFENLLEDNKDKGAYYTPKPVVSYMCRQSLLHYLETKVGPHELLTALVEKHLFDHTEKWSKDHGKKIADALDRVKICDPAIGSGAFPIGMLNEIVHLRTLINAELHDPAERAKLKRQIIQKSIYGVDLDSGAIDIARLRFWLALVVDEEEPSPLPNLDYKIMQGNSLIESFHGVDLSQLHEPAGAKPLKAPIGLDQAELAIFTDSQLQFQQEAQEKKNELLEARRAYFAARKPERKAELRAKIDAIVIEHITHYFEATLDEEETQLHQTEHNWAEKRKKLPKWNPAKAAQTRHAKLKEHIATLKNSLSELAKLQHQDERPFFLWHLLFQDVFKDGGFDIVIANPPYVRQELIKEQKPLLLAEGYTVYTGTADLLVYFYEFATNLLKPEGTLTFITSNKFYRAGYGEKLRTFLAENLTLRTLIDFRDAPIFNGVIAYASILIGTKGKAQASHSAQAITWDLEKEAAALPFEIEKAFPVRQDSLTPDGWRLVSIEITALLDKLREKGTPLGEYVEGNIFAGIKTGLNDAFLISVKEEEEVGIPSLLEGEFIKPYVRGKDIHKWESPDSKWRIIYIPRGSDLGNCPNILNHLGKHREKLENRALDQNWYELQQAQQAFEPFYSGRKIIYPNVSLGPRFTIDEGTYMDMTTFGIYSDQIDWLVAHLNSNIINYFFGEIGVGRRGGYQEFKTQYVKQFPVVDPDLETKNLLSQLAQKCATAANDPETLAIHEAEINKIIYRLFDLTDSEIALIESTLGIKKNPIPIARQQKGQVLTIDKLKDKVRSLVWQESRRFHYLSIKHLITLLEEAGEEISNHLLSRYLSEISSEGKLHNAGKGWFCVNKKEPCLDLSPCKEVQQDLKEKFPFLPHFVWSPIQLNPWMHHQFGQAPLFVHVDATGKDAAEGFLKSKGFEVFLNPGKTEREKISLRTGTVILRSFRRETDENSGVADMPTVLVECFLANQKLHFMDEKERQQMVCNILKTSRIDLSSVMRRLKEHKAQSRDFGGGEILGVISEF